MADNFLERHRQEYEERKQKFQKKSVASRIELYKRQHDDY